MNDGRTAEEAGRLLAPVVHLLRGVSRRTAGWIAHEPRLERKFALADHLADDARATHTLATRVDALAPEMTGAPEGLTAELLHRLDACTEVTAHLDLVYGEIKPLVHAVADAYLDGADALLERPTMATVLEIRADQRRHIDELPHREDAPEPDPSALATGPGEPHESAPVPAVEAPVRDPFVEQVEERPALDDVADALHALLHSCVAAGERNARQHHEAGHPGLARLSSVHLRHAAVADRLLAAHDSRWGQRPVGPPHDDPYVLAEAIALQHPSTARALGYVRSDRV